VRLEIDHSHTEPTTRHTHQYTIHKVGTQGWWALYAGTRELAMHYDLGRILATARANACAEVVWTIHNDKLEGKVNR
jgi:hypothetical protein